MVVEADPIPTASIINTDYLHKLDLKTDEQRLLYHLLRGYEKAARPVRNASTPIILKLGLTLTNIVDIDEKNQVLTTNVWLDQEWRDELLQWNPDDFNGITSIRIPCDLLWLPDIVLYNKWEKIFFFKNICVDYFGNIIDVCFALKFMAKFSNQYNGLLLLLVYNVVESKMNANFLLRFKFYHAWTPVWFKNISTSV